MRHRQTVRPLLSCFVVLIYGAATLADESQDGSPLTLADLAHYQRALAGRATADSATPGDPAIKASFKDLWEKTHLMRGRRVTVLGRVERIFRQGPVGSFPALAEVWIFSPAADPFCLVFAHGNDVDHMARNSHSPTVTGPPNVIPGPGQAVRFTGTFLKMVRYAASDGARLAPLIVGDRPPFTVTGSERRASPSTLTGKRVTGASYIADSLRHRGWSREIYAVVVIVIGSAIGGLTWRYLRSALNCINRDSRITNTAVVPDLPLEFIDRRRGPSTSGTS
jgi:hypothetical protein